MYTKNIQTSVQVTIAIVYYDGLSKEYFEISLNSALSQILITYKINIYTDSVDFDIVHPKINIIGVPKEIRHNPSKIREFIVETIDTPFVAFWDSDDVFTCDRLYKQIRLITAKDLDVCFSNFSFFDSDKIFDTDFFAMIGWNKREINIYDENYMGLGISTMRTSFLLNIIPFPEIDTLDWWIAIKSKLLNAKVDSVSQVLGYYRVYNNSNSKILFNLETDDYFKEKEKKIKLYSLLENENDELCKRKKYFEDIDLLKNLESIKKKYQLSIYKNIWGGLITYENK